jgi:hypothetical protein
MISAGYETCFGMKRVSDAMLFESGSLLRGCEYPSYVVRSFFIVDLGFVFALFLSMYIMRMRNISETILPCCRE